MTTLKDLESMKFGDEILCDTPFLKDQVYVYLGKMSWGSHMFADLNGASLIVKDDETIESFNVRIIDESHEKWDEKLHNLTKTFDIFFDSSLKDDVPL
jgi:hypothetical protein